MIRRGLATSIRWANALTHAHHPRRDSTSSTDDQLAHPLPGAAADLMRGYSDEIGESLFQAVTAQSVGELVRDRCRLACYSSYLLVVKPEVLQPTEHQPRFWR